MRMRFFSIRIKRDEFDKRVGVSPTVYIIKYYARTRTHIYLYKYHIITIKVCLYIIVFELNALKKKIVSPTSLSSSPLITVILSKRI
jgi:hypothetical protein